MDPLAPSTFAKWLELGPSDNRTLEEFAADPYGDRWCLCGCGQWCEGRSGYAGVGCEARTLKRAKKDPEFARQVIAKAARHYADALGDVCDHLSKAIGVTLRAPL